MIRGRGEEEAVDEEEDASVSDFGEELMRVSKKTFILLLLVGLRGMVGGKRFRI